MHTETLLKEHIDSDATNGQTLNTVETTITIPTYRFDLFAEPATSANTSVSDLVSEWIESDARSNSLASEKFGKRPGYMTNGTHWVTVEDFDRRFDDGEDFCDYFTSEDEYDPLMVPREINVRLSDSANAFIEAKAAQLGISKTQLVSDQIRSYSTHLLERRLEENPDLWG